MSKTLLTILTSLSLLLSACASKPNPEYRICLDACTTSKNSCMDQADREKVECLDKTNTAVGQKRCQSAYSFSIANCKSEFGLCQTACKIKDVEK